MRTHKLKTHPSYFDKVWKCLKGFEVRKDDRDFDVGDRLILEEWDPGKDAVIDDWKYTGRAIECLVKYKLPGGQFGIEAGYCVLSLGSIRKTVRKEDAP